MRWQAQVCAGRVLGYGSHLFAVAVVCQPVREEGGARMGAQTRGAGERQPRKVQIEVPLSILALPSLT